MGTNFYAYTLTVDEHDITIEESGVHLGKLSAGWLPVVPQRDMEDWLRAAYDADVIRDEYGKEYDVSALVGRFVLHALNPANSRVTHGPVPYFRLVEETTLTPVVFRHWGGEFS